MRTNPGTIAETRRANCAFTRTELALCVTAFALIAVVVMPSLASNRNRSQQAGCVDNLRMLGQAVQLWGVDHDNKPPWLVTTNEGGTRPPFAPPFVKVGAAWYEFAWLSNQIITPKILVCPSDILRFRNAADDWGNSLDGGYRNPKYRDNATSYTISLHAFFADPKAFLFSDRNLRVDQESGVTCAVGVNNAVQIIHSSISKVAWTNSIHGLAGNIVTADGRVIQTSALALRSYLDSLNDNDNGSLHFLVP